MKRIGWLLIGLLLPVQCWGGEDGVTVKEGTYVECKIHPELCVSTDISMTVGNPQWKDLVRIDTDITKAFENANTWTPNVVEIQILRELQGRKKMRRWNWLFVLPYVVIQTEYKGVSNYSVANASGVVVGTCTDQAFCNDLADALNDAHAWSENEQKRVEQSTEPEVLPSTPTEETDK